MTAEERKKCAELVAAAQMDGVPALSPYMRYHAMKAALALLEICNPPGTFGHNRTKSVSELSRSMRKSANTRYTEYGKMSHKTFRGLAKMWKTRELAGLLGVGLSTIMQWRKLSNDETGRYRIPNAIADRLQVLAWARVLELKPGVADGPLGPVLVNDVTLYPPTSAPAQEQNVPPQMPTQEPTNTRWKTCLPPEPVAEMTIKAKRKPRNLRKASTPDDGVTLFEDDLFTEEK